jgi:hypothetical protein
LSRDNFKNGLKNLDITFSEDSGEDEEFPKICMAFKIRGNEEFISIQELKKAIKVEFKYRELL